MKSFWNYVSFIHKVTLKKKNTVIIPVIWMVVSIIITFALFSFNFDDKAKTLIFYIVVFVELLLTALFSSIKSINIFKDLEEEGIELLTLSKPISRRKIVWGKTATNLLFGIYWSLLMSLSNLLIVLLGLHDYANFILGLISLPVFVIAYMIFGSFSSLIAYKMNAKVAITIPLVVFSPLVIGGTIISSKSTSTSNNVAYYLNSQYKNNPSGNVANIETFYLNDNKDTFYIIPNGADKKELRDDQINYLKEAFKYSKNSATEWQIYSYLSLPYQFVDYFNIHNINISDTFTSGNISNLNNYLYYRKNDNFAYNYDLNTKVNLKQYHITDRIVKKQDADGNFLKDSNGNDILESRINKPAYLVPGSLKSQSNIPHLINTDIIYAREGAEDFAQRFPEDKFVHSATDNLVGELKWAYIKELLESEVFDYYANKLATEISEDLKEASLDNISEIKSIIFEVISRNLKNDEYELLKINDIRTEVLNKASLENRKIKTVSEKKIYLATAFIYYLYFKYNDTFITDAILYNESTDNFDPHSYSIAIDNFRYRIGGFSKYVAKQQIEEEKITDSEGNESKERKVKIRYDIEPSSNYLFQPLDEVWQVSRNNNPTVNKNLYFIIWISLGFIFILANNTLYFKKDYK
ncbi:putative ABC transporter protein [Mycoplasmopsis canis PG 14]|uniref:ABC-type transport system involved in multi-copper enzyme maturation, permease component n=1 Tax=Mycoplasmopsis canis TaxID=29555 RepID=A0A449ARE6_9BACT|nr:ABC transporter permease [Mycoplasmopsis canis]AMD81115.1 ABC transporter [Mycoplasmopsis canis PG 14]EIE39819.1 putative ABC transporter protein [Mycoplasmopsis canis PG 14]VEU68936.1 ABC-type transport system involved in multi-copper enzyme maturation, permease component [Mycoplasmopsis canis]